MLRAGELLGEDNRLAVDDLRLGDAAGDPERRLQRLDDADAVGVLFRRDASFMPDHQAIDDDLDGVLAVLRQIEPGRFVDVEHVAVDAHADEPLPPDLLQDALVLPFAIADDRGQDHQPRAVRQRQDLLRHLLHGLGDDGPAALRAVGMTDAGEKEAQVIVDFGDGADRRAGVAAGPLLVDRDGRGEPVDVVDVRLLHLPEELAGVGGETFDVATLPFGENGVEGQRALARPGKPGEDDELVTRDVDVDVLEIVLPGAANANPVVLSHGGGFLARALGYSGEPSEQTIVMCQFSTWQTHWSGVSVQNGVNHFAVLRGSASLPQPGVIDGPAAPNLIAGFAQWYIMSRKFSKQIVSSMSPSPLVLASGSPRRRALLADLGLPFDVVVSDTSEAVDPSLDPMEQAMSLAQRKAEGVASTLARGLVLGADTIVVLDGEMFGKPEDDAAAARMLRRLSGREHQVITGVTLVDAATGWHRQSAVASTVRFRPLPEDEIAAYVATGEPRDKAGAYAIQGIGCGLIEGFDGCYANIIGLPLCEVAARLAQAGVELAPAARRCRLPNGAPCPRRV